MGAQIAMVAALSGRIVTLTHRDEGTLERACDTLRERLDERVTLAAADVSPPSDACP